MRGFIFNPQRFSESYRNTAEKLERLVFEDQDPSVQQEAFDALQNLPGPAIKASLTRIIETHPDAKLRQKAFSRSAEISFEEVITDMIRMRSKPFRTIRWRADASRP